MKDHRSQLASLFCLTILIVSSSRCLGQDTVIGLERFGGAAALPVSITGFTPEVTSVLQTDLIFMGFTNVPQDQAKFLITGTSVGQLAGRVVERVNRNQLFGRTYSGASLRAQAHAFSDDIATNVARLPGIARSKIAFKCEVGPGRSEVYVADYDGFNPQQITRDGSLVVDPSWVGRGALLYSSYKLGFPNIFSHNLATGARQAVARYPGVSFSPAPSPDGRRVAMILGKGGNPDLWISNLDGTGLQQLTNTSAPESSPCWSPDGRLICYVSKSSGINQLYLISPSGGAPRRILTSGVPNATEPDWSPNGKQIAFTTLMRDFHICVIDATGGRATVLVEGEDPSWSANSRALIFCKGPDHRKNLSLLDVPTKRVKDVGRISESNSQPSWAN